MIKPNTLAAEKLIKHLKQISLDNRLQVLHKTILQTTKLILDSQNPHRIFSKLIATKLITFK